MGIKRHQAVRLQAAEKRRREYPPGPELQNTLSRSVATLLPRRRVESEWNSTIEHIRTIYDEKTFKNNAAIFTKKQLLQQRSKPLPVISVHT